MPMNTTVLPKRTSRPLPGGFTLVELMVALTISLIVALAATGFVISLMKANTENLKVTRLTQELRAISEVMGREIRRARYVADPVGLIGSGGVINRDTITINGGGDCIIFSYDEPPDPPAAAVTVTRSIRRVGSSVVLNPAGSTCSGGSPISTPEVRITSLNFTRTASRVDIALVGELAATPPGLSGLSRTFRQTVYIRSGQVD